MPVEQFTQHTGHCCVFFSCRSLQSPVFSLTQSNGHGYLFFFFHHWRPPFLFAHGFMQNPKMRLSSLVLTVFQKHLNTWRECRPHKAACSAAIGEMPRTHPRMLWIVGSSSEVNGCQRAIFIVSMRLMLKNRVYPRFTTWFDAKWVKIELFEYLFYEM